MCGFMEVKELMEKFNLKENDLFYINSLFENRLKIIPSLFSLIKKDNDYLVLDYSYNDTYSRIHFFSERDSYFLVKVKDIEEYIKLYERLYILNRFYKGHIYIYIKQNNLQYFLLKIKYQKKEKYL